MRNNHKGKTCGDCKFLSDIEIYDEDGSTGICEVLRHIYRNAVCSDGGETLIDVSEPACPAFQEKGSGMDINEKLARLALPVKPGRNPNTHVGLTDAIGLPSDLSKEDCANAINDLAEVRQLVTEMKTAHDDIGKGLGDEPWIRFYTAFKKLEEKLGLRETDAKKS